MTLLELFELHVQDEKILTKAKKLFAELPKLPESADEATELLKSNRFLQSELDRRVRDSVESGVNRFKDEKLPNLIKEEKEKMLAELQPNETPEQKRVRELEQKIADMEKAKQQDARKAQLRAKAKSLNYDPLKAERYAIYGDEAENILLEDVNDFNATVDKRVQEAISKKYGGNPPEAPAQPIGTGSKREALIAKYNALETSNDPNKVAQMIGLKDQISKLPKE